MQCKFCSRAPVLKSDTCFSNNGLLLVDVNVKTLQPQRPQPQFLSSSSQDLMQKWKTGRTEVETKWNASRKTSFFLTTRKRQGKKLTLCRPPSSEVFFFSLALKNVDLDPTHHQHWSHLQGWPAFLLWTETDRKGGREREKERWMRLGFLVLGWLEMLSHVSHRVVPCLPLDSCQEG